VEERNKWEINYVKNNLAQHEDKICWPRFYKCKVVKVETLRCAQSDNSKMPCC